MSKNIWCNLTGNHNFAAQIEADVAEVVDAHDSKSCSSRSVGSNPTIGTYMVLKFLLIFYRFNPGLG